MEVKDYLRPPFSNYDVVVYFGCGLFSIPFINRYVVGPMELGWPRFQVSTGTQLGNSVVSFLALSFCIYIVGHIIAYISSQTIEKWADTIVGKISSVILSISDSKPGLRNRRIRNQILDNIREIPSKKSVIATMTRSVPHISQALTYWCIYVFGIFGQYNTRITPQVVARLEQTYPLLGIHDLRVSINQPWFKPLEYFIMNKSAGATARMYNYLVISGLFRSVSMIFLASSSMLVVHAIWARAHSGAWAIPMFFPNLESNSYLLEFLTVSILYFFSFASYVKFQRRYCEEAIYAFIFFGEIGEPLTLPAPVQAPKA